MFPRPLRSGPSASGARRDAPIRSGVERGALLAVVDDEQQMVVPHALEAGTGNRARAHGRIADQHAPRLDALDHDKVVVTVLAQQHDGGQVGILQRIQRLLEAVRLEALRLEIALDVEQREPLAPDLLLVAMPVHGLEHDLFADRIAVLVRQQRRHRGRAAAEIEALPDRAQEAHLLHARDRHGVQRAARARHVDRAGARRCRHHQRRQRPCHRQQRRPPHPTHGVIPVARSGPELHVDDGGVLDQHVRAGVLDDRGNPARIGERAVAHDVRPVATLMAALSVTVPDSLASLTVWYSGCVPPR